MKLADNRSHSYLYEYGKYLKGKNVFRYYCSRCERTKETSKPVEVCIRCGFKNIHPLANWSQLRKREIFKDNFKIKRKTDVKKSFLKRFDLKWESKNQEEELPSWEL